MSLVPNRNFNVTIPMPNKFKGQSDFKAEKKLESNVNGENVNLATVS